MVLVYIVGKLLSIVVNSLGTSTVYTLVDLWYSKLVGS